MSPVAPPSEAAAASRLYRRLDLRLLPFLFLCYLFACLDRLNVGLAKLQMQHDVGFSDLQYGIGAGIFFIGYALCEVPSNLWLARTGARRAISRILVLWGLVSAAMALTHDVGTFYVLRFLLGVFEAGFTPGILLYLTWWYPQSRMARAIAVVMVGGPIAGVVAGPVSIWAITHLAGVAGLAGWQWMFLVEGLPCVALGLAARVLLVDRPDEARWLTPAERQRLAAEVPPAAPVRHGFARVAADPRLYLMSAAYFCIICGIYLINFWLPELLKFNGVTEPTRLGLYASIPFALATLGMVAIGRRSDRRGERRWHSALPAFAGALCLALAASGGTGPGMALLSISLATAAIWMAYTVFWAIPPAYLKGASAAGGIALINTIGVTGGFLSPVAIGWLRTAHGDFRAGLWLMAAVMLVGALLLAAIRPPSAAGREPRVIVAAETVES
ncbi:MFS transporter [Burkholderia gladioli]|uniref:MFS transporter n=1 Tax=Burkholderia gladioli TaxID=28095 RepID=UPI0013F61E17|nr:MFS transporter [Burkholderia gladioli]NHH83551.1 putative tartrate transporter [Burkholderia gladioli]